MPAQPVLHPGALLDQILPVVCDQPDVHRPFVQVRGREAIDAVLDDRAGDRLRVDLIGLAALALALTGGAHHLRRHPDYPLARRQQRLLEATGDLPAVLDRPHPLLVQPARPADRRQMPGLVRFDLAAAARAAGSLVDRGERVRALVRIDSDHDHLHRPFIWLTADEADLRRTDLCRG